MGGRRAEAAARAGGVPRLAGPPSLLPSVQSVNLLLLISLTDEYSIKDMIM